MSDSFLDKVHSLGRALAGTALLVFGLAGFLFVAINLARDASLWILGRHTTAEVIASRIEETAAANPEDIVFHCSIAYQFKTPQGQVFTRTARVSANELVDVGTTVPIVYFPLYPDHNRLDESRYVPLLACAYVPLVLLCLGVVGAGWHVIRPRAKPQGAMPLRAVNSTHSHPS
jgi:hypothetical protein